VTEEKKVENVIRWDVSAGPSGGIYDPSVRRYVKTPKTDKGARYYATPAGIGSPKKGR
jgi:hypothetical protein